MGETSHDYIIDRILQSRKLMNPLYLFPLFYRYWFIVANEEIGTNPIINLRGQLKKGYIKFNNYGSRAKPYFLSLKVKFWSFLKLIV